jgi:hypothetical protein
MTFFAPDAIAKESLCQRGEKPTSLVAFLLAQNAADVGDDLPQIIRVGEKRLIAAKFLGRFAFLGVVRGQAPRPSAGAATG